MSLVRSVALVTGERDTLTALEAICWEGWKCTLWALPWLAHEEPMHSKAQKSTFVLNVCFSKFYAKLCTLEA